MISYKITPYERAFTFQILSQDRAVKNAIDSVGGVYYTSNGWQVMVKNSPEVKVVTKRLFLRGANKDNDMRIDRTWNFRSNLERDRAIASLEAALADIISFAKEYDNSRYFAKGDCWEESARMFDLNEEWYYIDSYGVWYCNCAPEAQLKIRTSKPTSFNISGRSGNKVGNKPMFYAAN